MRFFQDFTKPMVGNDSVVTYSDVVNDEGEHLLVVTWHVQTPRRVVRVVHSNPVPVPAQRQLGRDGHRARYDISYFMC